MRIGISGLSSTGKTTLARQVASVLQIPLLDEGMKDALVRREKKSCGGRLLKWDQLPIESKLEIQFDMIKCRSALEMSMESFVGDGTPLDVMAFWLEWSTHKSDSGRPWNPLIIEEGDKLLQKALARYDVIFQLPFGVLPIEDDNRRITDVRFLRKINHLLLSITASQLRVGGPCPVILNVRSLPLEDRINEVVTTATTLPRPSA